MYRYYCDLPISHISIFVFSAIIPKKKTRNNPLGTDDIHRNNRISSDRVIVENFFGRVCMMFGIMAGTYRWNREKFGMIVDFCFSLANFHIRLHPLREQDFDYYQKVLADLKRRIEEQSTMVKKRQQKHRARQARMKAVMKNLDEEVEPEFGQSTEITNYLSEGHGKSFLFCISTTYIFSPCLLLGLSDTKNISQSLFGEEEDNVDEIGSSGSSGEEEDDEEEDDEEEEEKPVDTLVDEANRLIRKELGLVNKGGGRTKPSGPTPAKKRRRYSDVYTPQLL